MTQYVALLRGINVGGGNIIKMADLKACFEKHGFTNVQTYIQSGNVVFETPGGNAKNLIEKIETMLSETFAYKARTIVRSHRQLATIVAKAPEGFGSKPANYRYYVLFLREPLTASEAIPVIPIKEGVDQAWAGSENVLFHQRLTAKATQSHLNRLVAMPIYQNMTIRNWNTTTKLLTLMEARKKN